MSFFELPVVTDLSVSHLVAFLRDFDYVFNKKWQNSHISTQRLSSYQEKSFFFFKNSIFFKVEKSIFKNFQGHFFKIGKRIEMKFWHNIVLTGHIKTYFELFKKSIFGIFTIFMLLTYIFGYFYYDCFSYIVLIDS